MASRTESMSGQMNENLTQQFATFVQQRAPQDAEAILTNTSSPEVAAQREAPHVNSSKSRLSQRLMVHTNRGERPLARICLVYQAVAIVPR